MKPVVDHENDSLGTKIVAEPHLPELDTVPHRKAVECILHNPHDLLRTR